MLTGRSGQFPDVGPTFDCVCKPDLVAPGRQIMACSHRELATLYRHEKRNLHVDAAGVRRQLRCHLEKDPLLSNVEVKMMLRESAEDMGLPRNQQGWGKFNCEKLLAG